MKKFFSGYYTYGFEEDNDYGFMNGEAKFVCTWDDSYNFRRKEEVILNFKNGMLNGMIIYKSYIQELNDDEEEEKKDNWKKEYSISAEASDTTNYFKNLVFIYFDENEKPRYVIRQKKSYYVSIYYCNTLLGNNKLNNDEKPIIKKMY